MITGYGFRELLEIGPQNRPDFYDLQADKPPLLVERAALLVPERLVSAGVKTVSRARRFVLLAEFLRRNVRGHG